MDYEKRKHNAPISTVIKNYLDKGGGKVVASRKEIEWRFNALDWRYQKQIIFAFLQSGKMDREWAYKKLYAFWDDCFIPVLQDLWEQHHEIKLSWLIIRLFPVEFLKNNFESLNVDRNYFLLCTRLFDSPCFTVNKALLNEWELLKIKRLMGEPITIGYAKDLFFHIVYKYCKGAYKFRALREGVYYMYAETPELKILNRPLINKMLYEIGNIDFYDIYSEWHVLSMELSGWIETVKEEFNAKSEMAGYTYWGDEEEELQRKAQMKHCYEYIDKEYTSIWDTFDINDQQQFLDYLEEKHKDHTKLEESEIEAKKIDHVLTTEENDAFLNKLENNEVVSALRGKLDLVDVVSIDVLPSPLKSRL